MSVTLYEVGGCVRDELLGIRSKDIDFTCEAGSYQEMREFLVSEGFDIFLENEAFLTIRARFPKHQWRFGDREMARMTCDFVLARQDGAYSDGRRPDEVTPGTIFDDLKRRDFTVNAIARASDGRLIDPHNGMFDLNRGVLRCVGSAADRISEDALRALRAIRFRITKGLNWDMELAQIMNDDSLARLLSTVSQERIREELFKAFKASTPQALWILTHDVSPAVIPSLFRDGLWLRPTLEE